jgi:hypothetical protein
MIDDSRIQAIQADPSTATADEIGELCAYALRWRPVNEFVLETLKAIHVNAKEATDRSLELDVIATASRTAMKRMQVARRDMG